MASWIDRHEAWVVSAILVAAVFFQSIAALSRLWYDEFFTFYIARLLSFDQMLRAIPGDGNPPLNYLLANVCMRLLGDTELAVRLPSILAFAAAMLAVYLFVRRRRGVVFACFAMLALATCAMASYGHEARPYALVLAFTGLTMLSWQAATEDGHPRGLPLLGVAAGIAGAIASHHYGAFHVGVPLLFGEAVRIGKRRRLDLPLYCACAAGLTIIAVTAPLARASQRAMLDYAQRSAVFWAKPNFWSMRSYGNMVNLWLPIAFLLLLWLTRAALPSGPAHGNKRIPAHEVAAAVGLVLLVPVIVIVTRLATGYYQGRYGIGAAMGVAILMGFAAPLSGGRRRNVTAVGALCVVLLVLVFAGNGTAHVIERLASSPHGNAGTGSLLDVAPGSEPIIVAGAMNFVPDWWYAPPSLRERLHYLADLPFAVRQPDFLPELSLVTDQALIPSKVDDYRPFLASHNRFLLYSTGARGREWMKERLEAEGWRLHPLLQRGAETLFVADAPRP